MSKREQEEPQFNNNRSATALLGPEGMAMLAVSDHVGEAEYAIDVERKDVGTVGAFGRDRRMLSGTALLAEGDVPEAPAKFAGLLANRLARTM